MIKTILFFATVFLTCHASLAGKDDKTLIEQIQEAESVPVYIELGDLTPGTYNVQMGLVPLLEYEVNSTFAKTTMPKYMDTLRTEIMAGLVNGFGTEKFIYHFSGTTEEINSDIKEKGYSFVVIARLSADYAFDYVTSRPKREIVNNVSLLIAHRNIIGAFNLGFYAMNEKNILDKCASDGGFAYDSPFVQQGYTKDINVLLEARDPAVLENKFRAMILDRLPSFAEKMQEKHDKQISKRK